MLWYLVIGIVSGIVSGMGIGGGTVLIPLISIFFDMPQKAAQSLNLIYFIPTASAALVAHIKNKRIQRDGLGIIIPFGIAGAIVGSLIAFKLGNDTLPTGFGYFLLLMGIREIYIGIKAKKEPLQSNDSHSTE